MLERFTSRWMLCLAVALWSSSSLSPAVVSAADADVSKQRCPKPAEFGNVFSFGYGEDDMPQDDAKFEEMLKKIKPAGYNIVHCAYTDSRLALCKKHGVKMMVHLLEPKHHVYKSLPEAKALCEQLRDNPDVWGYNIWNDKTDRVTAKGRVRDINNVRTWDPTHPAYCGGYRDYGMRHITNADVLGYYDFHWDRGIDGHLGYSQKFLDMSRNTNAIYYSWFAAAADKQPGEKNVQRTLWSCNIGMACGLKGILWFTAGTLMDKDKIEFTPHGLDLNKVNAEIMPLKAEIMKIGLPTAVYGTKVTKTMKNEPQPGGAVQLPGVAAVPADFWAQPTAGEFVMGVFKDAEGHDALFVANYNAHAPQQVAIKLAKPVKASLFDRKAGQWKPLEAQEGAISFPLSPGGGELVRFE